MEKKFETSHLFSICPQNLDEVAALPMSEVEVNKVCLLLTKLDFNLVRTGKFGLFSIVLFDCSIDKDVNLADISLNREFQYIVFFRLEFHIVKR